MLRTLQPALQTLRHTMAGVGLEAHDLVVSVDKEHRPLVAAPPAVEVGARSYAADARKSILHLTIDETQRRDVEAVVTSLS